MMADGRGVGEGNPFADNVPLPQGRLELQCVGKCCGTVAKLTGHGPNRNNLCRSGCLLARSGRLKPDVFESSLELGAAG